MNKPLKTCLLPLFAALHGHVIAADAECGSEITGACNITSTKTDKGPLFTIMSGTSGAIDVTSNVEAQNRGEAFLISGKSPAGTLSVNAAATVTSDYSAIRFMADSAIDTITLDGTVQSNYDSAVKIESGAAYDLTINKNTGKEVKTESDYHPAIAVDVSSSGTLTVNGAVTGKESGIQYIGSSEKGKFLAPGEHTLTLSNGSSINATETESMGAALLFGSPANINISDTLPEFRFKTISIDGSVTAGGAGAGIALVHGNLTSDTPLVINIGEHATITGDSAGIRLGKTGSGPNDSGKSYASFTGEIHNKGIITASDNIFIAEGDIAATFVNEGTIKNKTDSKNKDNPEFTALNLEKTTQPFTFKQTDGETVGHIEGSSNYQTKIVIEDGIYTGNLISIVELRLKETNSFVEATQDKFSGYLNYQGTGNSFTFKQSNGITKGNISGTTSHKATVEVAGGSFKGSLSETGTLTVGKNASLYLTEPASLGSVTVGGMLETSLTDDLNTALLTADTLTFNTDSHYRLHVESLKTGTKYLVLSGLTSNSVPLSTSNMLFNISEEATAKSGDPSKYEYSVTFTSKNTDQLKESLKGDNISNNQVRSLATSLEHAPEKNKQLLVKASEDSAMLKKLARELTPHPQTSVTSLQGTSHKVAARVSSRLSGTSGISTGDFKAKGFWVQASSSEAEQDREKDDPGFKSKDKGFSIGYDVSVDEGYVDSLGVAFSSQDSDISYKSSRDKLGSTLYLFTLYGEKAMNGSYMLQGQLSYGWVDNDTKRYVNNAAHKADYDSTVFNAQFLLKRGLSGLDIPGLTLVGGLNITHVDTDSYTFSGEYLNDHILKSDSTAIELGAGLEFSGSPKQGFSPHGSLVAWYDLKDDKLDTRYTIGTSPVITIKAQDRERLSLAGELGFDYIANNITYSVDLSGIWRSGFKDTGLIGRIRFEF